MTRVRMAGGRARTQAQTIVDVLRRRACDAANQPGYVFLGDSEGEATQLTYAKLDERARAIGGWLQQQVPARARVLLLYPPGLEYIEAFFGCLYAGAIAVPAYPPRQSRAHRGQTRLETLIEDADVTMVLTSAPAHAKVQAFIASCAASRLRCEMTTDLAGDLASDWHAPRLGPDAIAFLQYTSGSTSNAKGVMVTHANIMANERMIQAACGHTSASTFVGWLPVYHDMGLLGNVLQPLYIGAQCVLMSPAAFLQKPVRWLRAISEYGGHTSGGPNFAYALCTHKVAEEDCAGLDLSSWRIAFNGAEPVHAETLEQFATRFAPYGFARTSFFPCYGLAESTLMVSGGPTGTGAIAAEFSSRALEERRVDRTPADDASRRRLVACGTLVPDTSVAIVEPETRRHCAAGRIGEIWVSSAAVARGYWNDPQRSEAQFRARVVGGGRTRFLRTGDLGFVEDDRLYVTGRLRDLIIIRGQNHHPEDLEWTVQRAGAAVRIDSSAAFSIERDNEERVVILIEVNRRADSRIDTIASLVRAAIAEHHELQVDDVVLVEAGSLPKTSSGKLQRYLCRHAYLHDTLSVIARDRLGPAAMTVAQRPGPETALAVEPAGRPAAIASYLQHVFAERLRTAAPRRDVSLVGLGIDSLTAVEAAHRVQTELGVPLSMASVLGGATIDDLAASLCAAIDESAVATPVAGADVGRNALSQGQRALWFVHQLDPDSPAYNVCRALDVAAPLDAEALRHALAGVGDLHAQLQTTVFRDGNDWLQRQDPAARPLFAEVDASAWTDAELDAELQRAADQPFDLERGPVMRLTVFHLAPERHVLLLGLHHIAGDLWSFGILLRHLAACYGGAADAAPIQRPAASYSDFVRWQARTLAGDGERLWRFWKDALSGELAPLDLLSGGPRPAQQTYRGARHRFRLQTELTTALRELARGRGVTPYVVLMAAFQIVLQRYSGVDDFLVGSPVAGRSRAEFGDVVGNFINLLPIRARIQQERPFVEFLADARARILGALAHQEYPFSLMVERLQPARDPSRPPLCQVLFAMQQAPRDDDHVLRALALQEPVPLTLVGLPTRPRELRNPAVPFELILTMAEVGGDLHGTFEFNCDLFETATIHRMTELLTTVLAHAVRHPEARLSEYPTLTDAERTHILGPWNAVAGAPDAMPLPLLEHHAALTPDAIAVVRGAEQYTYRAVDDTASRVAALLRARGVAAEGVVALEMSRSPKVVMALLGVMKAGAAFLPIDPEHPPSRIAFMLRDAGVRVLLTDGQVAPPDVSGLDRVDLDVEGLDQPIGEQRPAASPHPDQLAYVIYTSGSTGVPKGVQISHRALGNFLACIPARIGLGRTDTMIASTSLSFDIALLELLAPLTVGAKVCIAEKGESTDPDRMSARLAQWGVTMMQATPTVWRLLSAGAWTGGTRLTVLCGGETLLPELAARLRRDSGALYNMYGPTETTIWSATHPIVCSDRPPALGGPIANTQLYVVDAEQNLAPVGVAGELYIGGAGGARGYVARPDLTADRFVPDRFGAPGARVYRTGDRAYVGEDGVVHFVGRRDGQVKRRGVRIELREIEVALRAQAGVADAAAVVSPDDENGPQLAAYVVPEQPGAASVAALYDGLSAILPISMLPDTVQFLDRLPTTPNGKLDRRALPAPDRPSRRLTRAPRSPLEELLAAEWARVLGCEAIGIDENFFALGGHSLLATELVWQLQDVFPTSTPMLRLLFRHATVAEFAAGIEQHTPDGVDLTARIQAMRRVQVMSDDEVDAALRSDPIAITAADQV